MFQEAFRFLSGVPRVSSSRLEDPHIDERSNKKRVGFSGMTGINR